MTVRTFVEAPLTIAAGAELEFAQNASLTVRQGGSLRAAGVPGNPVVFRGGEDLVGYWQGIEVDTRSAGNVLTHVSFHNAGSQAWFGGGNRTATLHVTHDGSVSLANVTFRRTGGYSVILGSGGRHRNLKTLPATTL